MSVWDMVFYGCTLAVVAALAAMLVSTALLDWTEDKKDREDINALMKGENHG